ncbi:MAG: hypothetical protein EAX87_08555 [Candidatus Thorarchaeota archaeon]|nr:hypothetical protein [Candidatus Thorarchaeota archaeon]
MQRSDSEAEEFIDIRRKVGNQIIRKYLLNTIAESDKITRISGKLRGPKNEFKDFAKFLILELSIDGMQAKFLAESGVYENLRIVAVNSNTLAERSSESLIQIFTESLESPALHNASIVLSDDSSVI